MTQAFLVADSVSQTFSQPVSWGGRLVRRVRGDAAASVPGAVHAVNAVSLSISRGEVLGLVGESGCGKSTLGRMLTGIQRPTLGDVMLDGHPVMRPGTSRKIDRRVQMVFQNPFSSLNPRIRVGKAIAEGPIAHGLVSRDDANAYVAHWLERVGIDPSVANRYPHQFSGGQRQRIAIARALAMQPDVLVCDEPVASLDVSIQAQIINLFLKLRRELSLTMLFISHDLGVVRHICDRVAVMYLGRIVESGPTEEIYSNPLHPYTKGLLNSIPVLRLDQDAATFHAIAGELPSPLSPPSGCTFHTRCPIAEARCRAEVPMAQELVPGHQAACHVATREIHGARTG